MSNASTESRHSTRISALLADTAIDFGVSREVFRARYFEKNYLLIRGALQSAPFEWSDIDELLYRVDPLPPYFKLFKDGEIAAAEFVDEALEFGAPRRRINKAKFYDYLRGGATVVMNRIESSSRAARGLCRVVSRFAGHPAIGNAYLSFGGNGTFGEHWDTHDVFVIQLLGRKRWQVFAPTWPLPLSHQSSVGQLQRSPSAPVLECELAPGDVLYLPRGWWHRATPCNGGSFHLSVGTYAPTALEFVQWVCQRRLSLLESARIGLCGDSQQALDVDAIVSQLGQALRDPRELTAFHRSLAERETVCAEFDLQSQVDSTAELHDDACVHLNSCYPLTFNGAHLTVNGMELRLESLRRALVLQLDKVTAMTVRSLYACAPSVPPAAVRAAIVDLAQHDVVTIRR